VVYLRFNLVEGGANQWGIAKRGFYLRTSLAANGPFVLWLALGFVAGLRRTWPMALLALLYLVVLSLIPHKELRFSLPVLPLFLVCAAVGLAALIQALPFPLARRRAAGLALGAALLVAFAWRARNVTFKDLGQAMPPVTEGGPTSSLVWGAFDERNRLFGEAAKHADLCGLAAPDMNPYWTGGYTYLHRRVPLLWSGARHELAAANYVITSPGQRFSDPRYLRVAQAGRYQLLRREGACVVPSRGSTSYGRLTVAGVPGS
jgi:GPI mannosyltransferase 3